MSASRPMLRWAHLPECQSLPEGWIVARFTTVAKVIAGQSPPSETYNDKGLGLPFLQGNADFGQKYPVPEIWCTAPKKTAKKDDTLISVRAPVGEVNRADQDYAIGRGLAALRATGIDQDFLFQAIQRWRWSLQRVAQGTTFDAVTARHFGQLHVAIPLEPEEQQAIARILDTVDTVIEQTQGVIKSATALRTSLVEEVFDRIGSAPRKLGEYITDIRYGTSRASNERHWGYPTLRIPNIIGDEISYDDIVYVDVKPAEASRLRINDGDLLLVRTNGNPYYVGRSAIFKTPDQQDWIFASYLIRVRLVDELVPEYVSVFLGTEQGRRELLRRVTTSAGNHNINANSIRLIALPIPESMDDQKRTVKVAEKSLAYVTELSAKISALEGLKRALMKDLLTGKVRANGINMNT